MINYIIYALGMKGQVIDRVFVPYREADGTFPIYSEEMKETNGSDKLQKAENKVVGVRDVGEAVRLMRVDGVRSSIYDFKSWPLRK